MIEIKWCQHKVNVNQARCKICQPLPGDFAVDGEAINIVSENTPKSGISEHDPFDDLVESGGYPEAQALQDKGYT